MDARFAATSAEDNLRGLTPGQFAARAAEHICDLNAIHCFLDGNGRTQRAFLEMLAAAAGHPVDLARIDPTAWNEASARGYHTQDYGRCKTSLRACSVNKTTNKNNLL